MCSWSSLLEKSQIIILNFPKGEIPFLAYFSWILLSDSKVKLQNCKT